MVYVHNLDPVLLNIAGFEIRYYGLIYIIGLVLGYFIFRHIVKKKKIGMKDDDMLDLVIYVAFGVLLGSRLFYFIFYNFNFILDDPLLFFKIWQGGMSFHGGLIGVVVAGYIFCKVKKYDFLELADIVVVPAALALALGRITNFINGELVGRITDVSWAVDFGDGELRHPSQLYESAKNFFMFGVLWFLQNKKMPKGGIFLVFVLMYGVLRFFIEYVREPDPQLGFVLFGLSMGQVLCLIMIVFSVIGLVYVYRKK